MRSSRALISVLLCIANLGWNLGTLGVLAWSLGGLSGYSLTMCSRAWASDPPAWDGLRTLYDQGKIDDALQLLQSNASSLDASHYYNLGTLSYRVGQVGKSVAYLEKAHRLAPEDADTLHNLALARSALAQKLGPSRLDPGASPMDGLVDQLRSTERQALLALVTLAVLLLGFRRFLRTQEFKDPSTLFLGGTGLALCFLLLSVSQFPALIGAHPAVIALERDTVRSGPGPQFLELTPVEAGTKLRLTGIAISNTVARSPVPSGSGLPLAFPSVSPSNSPPPELPTRWHQVRFSKDGIGWVREAQLLFL